MWFKVYVTMEFVKEIEADSKEEAWEMADDIEFDWEDCCDQETFDVVEVDE